MRTITSLLLAITAQLVAAQSLYDNYNHSNYRNCKAFRTTISIDAFEAPLLNACLFFATNEIRVQHKLKILSYHPKLEKAATTHSVDMVKYNFFDHTNNKVKAHREPDNRARISGIRNPFIAENIAEGFVLNYEPESEVIPKDAGIFIDPKTNKPLAIRSYLELSDYLMNSWMESDGHRENILSKDALQLGCGNALFYMSDFNNMPVVKATQCFQWFEIIE